MRRLGTSSIAALPDGVRMAPIFAILCCCHDLLRFSDPSFARSPLQRLCTSVPAENSWGLCLTLCGLLRLLSELAKHERGIRCVHVTLGSSWRPRGREKKWGGGRRTKRKRTCRMNQIKDGVVLCSRIVLGSLDSSSSALPLCLLSSLHRLPLVSRVNARSLVAMHSLSISRD